MAAIRKRRLPVVTRQKQLVGIISLGDLATRADEPQANQALKGISN
jgi:CBS-domain-containing membrane protein